MTVTIVIVVIGVAVMIVVTVMVVVIRTMAPPVFSGGIRSSTMIKIELNIMEIPDTVKKRQAY